jgi:HAD superfamily hydrolase (TIGR01490 family)
MVARCYGSDMPRPAAYFDLDGTLITKNSGRLWMMHERRAGRIRKRDVVRGLGYLLGYRFGAIDLARAFDEASATLAGTSEQIMRERVRAFFDDEVKAFEAERAREVIEQHRALGHRLVLLTSSSSWQAECATEFFGLDDAIGTSFEARDGVLTGKVMTPLCYAGGKVALAEQHAREHDIDLSKSYFYTDSITDLPMLERVGEPRIVNPDPRLERVARARGYARIDLFD